MKNLIVSIFLLSIVQQNFIISSSSDERSKYLELLRKKDEKLKQIIIYEPTQSLIENLNSLQVNFDNVEKIKQELLEQNELDIFSRVSIHDLFQEKNYLNKLRFITTIEKKLCNSQGKNFEFDLLYARKRLLARRLPKIDALTISENNSK